MVVVVFETDGDWSEQDAKKVQNAIMKNLSKGETMGRWYWFWTSCPETFEEKVLKCAEETQDEVSEL